jgi:hypothetical protein
MSKSLGQGREGKKRKTICQTIPFKHSKNNRSFTHTKEIYKDLKFDSAP